MQPLVLVCCRGVTTLVTSSQSTEIPTSTIALSLILGFIFMLVVERQLTGAHEHTPLDVAQPKPATASSVEFDVELGDLEQSEAFDQGDASRTTATEFSAGIGEDVPQQRAYPLTLGLVVHALADGLALGSAAFSDTLASEHASAEESSYVPSGLSLAVFIALVVHKGACGHSPCGSLHCCVASSDSP